MSATASLQATDVGPHTFSVRASQSKSRQHSFFFLVSLFGPFEATGQPHSDNFLEPEGKGPFCEFLCNPAPAATRVGGSRLGPGLAGLGGSGAGALPRRSRVRGPRPSRLLPRPCLGDPGGPAVLHAGGPARRGRAAAGPCGPAAVATGAHSIRTCRRTLSITEATT